jgi:hypothetical protein
MCTREYPSLRCQQNAASMPASRPEWNREPSMLAPSDVDGYHKYPGVDLQGSRLSTDTSKITEAKECAELCSRTPNCNAFSFYKLRGANACHLNHFRGPLDIPGSTANTGQAPAPAALLSDDSRSTYVKVRR